MRIFSKIPLFTCLSVFLILLGSASAEPTRDEIIEQKLLAEQQKQHPVTLAKKSLLGNLFHHEKKVAVSNIKKEKEARQAAAVQKKVEARQEKLEFDGFVVTEVEYPSVIQSRYNRVQSIAYQCR